MTSRTALQSLGVHSGLLSADERSFLDENGYLLLNSILTEDEVVYLRHRLDELAKIEGNAAYYPDECRPPTGSKGNETIVGRREHSDGLYHQL